MKLSKLIGFQLVDLSDEVMVVQKDSTVYAIEFNHDEGDCCGFTNVHNTLLFDKNDSKENPVITNIERIDSGAGGDCDSITLTLFGGYKPLAKISAEASSGSGWCYGATVTVNCKPLQIDECLASW